MTKEEYMKIYDAEPDEITISDADIKDWLDSIVDGLIKAMESRYSLCWGKLDLDEGEYENEIYPCGGAGEWDSIHIFSGIEKLAKALNCKLELDRDRKRTDYPNEYYFKYRGIRVFQLEKEGYEIDITGEA